MRIGPASQVTVALFVLCPPLPNFQEVVRAQLDTCNYMQGLAIVPYSRTSLYLNDF